MSPREPHPVSRTHERAILQQDNGELAEDVLETDAIDAREREGDLDEQLDESFPASDPPSSWGGEAQKHDARRHRGRLVDRSEVAHPPERDAPDDPVPKTLPRDER